jgi:vacuolar-type H+-ATPase subunit I/STV1
MSLGAFATSRNLDQTTGEKQIWFKSEVSISRAGIDAYLQKISNLIDRMIIAANQIIKLDKKPEKIRGVQKKIQKTVQKFQALNDETSLVQIAMQDNIAQVIGTSEKAQKIVTHADFFKKVKRCAAQLKHATKVH